MAVSGDMTGVLRTMLASNLSCLAMVGLTQITQTTARRLKSKLFSPAKQETSSSSQVSSVCSISVVRYYPYELTIFIDTHIHAPQFPNIGLFGLSGLLDWLNEYTYPTEASFGSKSDPKNQQTNPNSTPPEGLRAYDEVVARTLAHSTTCASYFATIHVLATNALAALCYSHGQRAFIGRACMDNKDICLSYYID